MTPVCPPLPQTGTTGGSALLFLLALGVLILAITVFSSKRRKAGTALGLLLVMGGATMGVGTAPVPAFADTGSQPCISPTSTNPTARPSSTPQSGSQTVNPTIAPSPSATATVPTPKYITGSISINGNRVVIPNPPGVYATGPRPTRFNPNPPSADPNGTWELPHVESHIGPLANQKLIVTSAGADGVLGTADDQPVATAQTNADGTFSSGALPSGKYRVTATLPPDPDMRATWKWGNCQLAFRSASPGEPGPVDLAQGYKFASTPYFDVTLSDTNTTASAAFRVTSLFGFIQGSSCQVDPI